MSRLKINKHHIWHHRRQYADSLEVEFREHPGFVVPTLVVWHNLLHENEDPPPKPTHDMMGNCLDYVGEFNPDMGRLSTLHLAMDFFKNPQNHYTSREAILGAEIYDNLMAQLGYLSQVNTTRVEYVNSGR